MSTIYVHMFHRFEIRYNEIPVTIDVRKAQELLCYLVIFRHQPHPREVLAGRLWGETSTAQSRSNLRKTLWQLQSCMDTTEDGAARLLQTSDDWVQLHPDATLWSDVALLETAYHSVEGVRGRAMSAAQADLARQAVVHYRGELLEGWYLDWCLVERQQYRFMALALLDKLCGFCEARQEYDAAISYALRILRHEPARENAHRRLMQLYALAGDRTAALRQYAWCVAALHQELDIGPDEQTIQLHTQLQRGQFAPSSATTIQPDREAQELATLLHRLEQIQGSVNLLQQQLAGEVQSLRALFASPLPTP
ncbi:MAG: bacterial transcriptional activator domain-containing protein [Caldilineaceae bacterium]|nr:bacterial transcriptional activator domain-containing protein [Caldilineaceae bacterium]